MNQTAIPPPPTPSVIAFVGIVLGVQALLVWAVWRTAPDPASGRKRAAGTALAFGVILAATFALGRAGIMTRETRPPPPMIYFAVCNGAALGLALTRPGRALARAPVAFWLLLQGFRLPLEVVLHRWHEAGTIPVQMTWSGQNLDVVSGVAGLALGAVLLLRPRATWAGWLGHAVGLALLLNVMRIAMTSVPGPLKRPDVEPLLLPLHAPYLWIVPFCVSAALFGHVVGLRGLARAQSRAGLAPEPAP